MLIRRVCLEQVYMRIGVDVDEVLGDNLRVMLPWMKEHYGVSVAWRDMWSYKFYESWDETPSEAREQIDAFIESHAFATMPPVKGSQEAVHRLANNGHELFVVTSRPRFLDGVTEDWLHTHFGDVFEDTLYTDMHGFGEETPKHVLAQRHGLDVHLDDNAEYACHVSEVGVPVVLFNKPWNALDDTRWNTYRADSWGSALHVLQRL